MTLLVISMWCTVQLIYSTAHKIVHNVFLFTTKVIKLIRICTWIIVSRHLTSICWSLSSGTLQTNDDSRAVRTSAEDDMINCNEQTLPGTVKTRSLGSKGETKAKFHFDVCRLFCDIFCLFFDFLHFRYRFRLLWIGPKELVLKSEGEHESHITLDR